MLKLYLGGEEKKKRKVDIEKQVYFNSAFLDAY